MGYQHLVDKMFTTSLPPTFESSDIGEVNEMTNWLIRPVLKFFRKECKEQSPTQDQHVVMTYLKILTTLLKPYHTEDKYMEAGQKGIITIIDGCALDGIAESAGMGGEDSSSSSSTENRESWNLFHLIFDKSSDWHSTLVL